jgi:hypothetical protein
LLFRTFSNYFEFTEDQSVGGFGDSRLDFWPGSQYFLDSVVSDYSLIQSTGITSNAVHQL